MSNKEYYRKKFKELKEFKQYKKLYNCEICHESYLRKDMNQDGKKYRVCIRCFKYILIIFSGSLNEKIRKRNFTN